MLPYISVAIQPESLHYCRQSPVGPMAIRKHPDCVRAQVLTGRNVTICVKEQAIFGMLNALTNSNGTVSPDVAIENRREMNMLTAYFS